MHRSLPPCVTLNHRLVWIGTGLRRGRGRGRGRGWGGDGDGDEEGNRKEHDDETAGARVGSEGGLGSVLRSQLVLRLQVG